MVVRSGREFLALPGPTNIPDEVLRAMHRPAADIYSGELVALTDSLLSDLSKLFGTKGKSYIYIANGHGAWEAVLTNILSRGDTVLVLDSGRFPLSWGEAAQRMGAKMEVLKGDWSRAVRPDEVEARLKADTGHRIKAILAVQIDTAAGVVNDIPAIGKAIRAANHPALYVVDAVASLACMPFAMDEWGIDVTMSAAQKGLMTPPGLSFVAVGDRARAVHATADMRTPYWDWTARDGKEHYFKYAGTPPVHLLYALRRALDLIAEEGLDNIYIRHRLLAEAVRRAVTMWTEPGALSFNITDPAQRSDTVTTILTNNTPGAAGLRDYCSQKCGLVLGTGIGALQGKAFRIAHMGHINAPMILGTLSVVEMGLQALQIPHGRGGTAAAIDYLAQHVTA